MASHTTTRAPALGGLPRAVVVRPRTRAWRLAAVGMLVAVLSSVLGVVLGSAAISRSAGMSNASGEPLVIGSPPARRISSARNELSEGP